MKRDRFAIGNSRVILTLCWVLVIGVRPASPQGQTFDPLEAFNANGFDQNRDYFSGLPTEHIDPMTGNLLLTFTDLALPGNAGLDLRIQRVYNSKIYKNFDQQGELLGEDSWAGVGWTMHLGRVLDPEGVPVIELSDGSRHPTFRHIDGSGHFITKEYWVYDRNLTAPKLMLPSGVVYTFGAHINGIRHVTQISDPFGNTIDVTYGNAGAGEPADGLKTITQHLNASNTRVVTFTYETTVARKSLKTITYVGDKTYTWTYLHTTVPVQGPLHSLLTEVKPPVGPSWRYAYYQSASPRYELQQMTAPGGGWTQYSYSTVTFYEPGSLTLVDTRAVTQKTAGGRDITPGAWTFSYAEGTNRDRSTFNTPCGQIKYEFLGIGNQTSQVEAWQVGLMKSKEIRDGGSLLEREELVWQKGAAISVDPYFTGQRADFDTWVPLLQKRIVTRDSRTFTTENIYGSSNFNDYGRPYRVVETGDRTRTTDFTFDYDFVSSVYIKDKIETETVTGDGKTLTKSFFYDNATGFKDSENIYGVPTTYFPDSDGNVARVEDALNRGTNFTYDWGVVKNTSTALHTIQRTVNQSGTVSSVTRRSLTTTFDYDTLFRIRIINPPLGADFVYTYDDSQGTWIQLSRDTTSQRTDLDGFGRPSATLDAVGVKRDFAYDPCGRMVTEWYPFIGTPRAKTDTAYDALGRVTRRTHADGSFVTFDYSGLDVTITNERGIDATQHWEAWGDPQGAVLTGVVDQDNQSWTYDYDVVGNLVMVDPAGPPPQRTWVYNTKNQLQSESHPENGTTQYTYYANGNLQTRVDPEFGTTTYTYDNNNRLTYIDWPGASFTDLDYDDSDNRTLLETELVRTTFGYDGANRITSRADLNKSELFTLTANFEYDVRDNVKAVTYPRESGQRLKVDYSYDNANRITQVAEVGGSGTIYAQSFQYHPGGGPLQYSAGNGYTHQFEYHPDRYWVTDIYDSGGPEQVLDLQYLHDEVGNVESINDHRAGMDQQFWYDPLDRLVQANGPWGGAFYSYDVQGNRTNRTVAGASTTFQYSGTTNRLTSATGANPDSFGYDLNGNLRTTATGAFTYNPRNMMVSSSVAGVNAAYGYDGDNLRTYKASGSVTSYYFRGLGDLLLSEFETACGAVRAPARDYIYAGSRLLAAVKYRPDPPVAIGPVAPTNDTTPTFEWGASSGADSYDLWVENLTDGSTALNVSGISTTTYTPSTALPSGKTYRWQVRAVSGTSSSCYSEPETFELDVVPPAAVALIGSVPSPATIRIDWTAPGDDGNAGTAIAYDVRYQQGSTIDFDTATQAVGEPTPAGAGTPQTFQITGLPAEVTFAVALQSVDDAANVSAVSNVVVHTALDITPPEPVANLQASNPAYTTVNLQWTAPHEDGAGGGAVSSYDVRYSTSPIVSSSFAAATQANGEPTPGIPGTVQTTVVSGLVADTQYYFALKSIDGAGNASAMSNVTGALTLDNVPPSAIANLAASAANSYVALAQTAVSASGESAPTYVKEKIVDGSLSTYWSTPDRATMQIEQITVDLGSVRNVGRVRLRSREDNGAYFPRDFQIQLSSDNVNFVTVLTRLDFVASLATWYESDFAVLAGRYVRIYVTESNLHPSGAYFVQIAEIETFEAVALSSGARLSWTAPGDSGMLGTATSYDARYSTAPILSEADFASAVTLTGEPAPQPAGSTEVFTATGLPAESVVYFAVKTLDEVPNVSGLSNAVSYTTSGVAPGAVTDLQANGGAAGSVFLTWTATGDDGALGTATVYDVRHATTPITAGASFDGATQATGEPVPGPSGAAETMTVSGLSGDTLYYFAMKVGDEVSNFSGLSNVVSATTLDTQAPAAIADLAATAATGSVYTGLSQTAVSASGDSDPNSAKEKVVDGNVSTLWSTPGRSTMQVEQITVDVGSVRNVGRVRLRSRADNGAYFPRDFQIQLSSDNVNFATVLTRLDFVASAATWYELDFAVTSARYVRIYVTESVMHSSGLFFVQIAEIETFEATPVPSGVNLSWTAPGDSGSSGTATSYDARYSTSPINSDADFATSVALSGEPSPQPAGSSELFTATGLPAESVVYFAVKTSDEVPNVSGLSNVVSYTTSGVAPGAVTDLQASGAAAGSVVLTWTATGDDGNVGTATTYDVRYATTPIAAGASFDGATQATGEPVPGPSGTSETMTVSGLNGDTLYYFAMKVGDEVSNFSGLSNVVSATTLDTQAPAAIANLTATAATGNVYTGLTQTAVSASGESDPNSAKEKAVDGNVSTLWSTPGRSPMQVEQITVDVGSVRNVGRVRLRSRADNGAYFPRDFQIQLSSDNVNFVTVLTRLDFVASAATWYELDFAVTAARYVRIYVTESVMHPSGVFFVQIAEIETYEATPIASGVNLSWTAPGDSGTVGTATSYDARYSTGPIVSEADYASAVLLSGEPVPQPAGSPELFTATGLPAETVLYFAVKTSDEVPNVSGLSNVVSYTTEGVAPAAVTDLQASGGAAGSVVLTWTATGDDGSVGTATVYDVRYQTTPITSGASFDGATQATGEPVPGPSGAAETMTVSGLSGDTLYYFALKVGDEVSSFCGVSNVVSATTLDTQSPAGIVDLSATSATGNVYTGLSQTAVSASGENDPTTVKGKAVDGDVSTLWGTPGRSTMQVEQITVDVGSVRNVGRVRLRSRADNGAYFPRDFQIQLSSDNVNFVTVLTRLDFVASAGVWYEFDFTVTAGRYVRIYVTESVMHPSGVFFVQIAEIETYEVTSQSGASLSWTATGDNGSVGTATTYQMRYSGSPIVTEGDFSGASVVSSPPTPGPSGTAETFTVSGLGSGTVYFVVRAVDEAGNASPLSNSASVTLP